VAADTTPPSAPTNVLCSAGGGSGEFDLSWDAPADSSDIAGVKIYVSDNGGPFNRLRKLALSDGFVDTNRAGGARWAATAFPVPSSTPIELAVTTYDLADNESGWNPVDAYMAHAASSCNSGPPPALADVGIHTGAGSGEMDIRFLAPALDIASYSVSADQGSGMAPLEVMGVSDAATAGYKWMTVMIVNWSLSSTYRIWSTDFHGNDSPVFERTCPPMMAFDDVC